MTHLNRLREAVNWKYAAIGGSLAALICIGGGVGISSVGAHEAVQMLDSIRPSTRFLASAIITGSSTILALMLTMLSFSSQKGEGKFETQFYNSVYALSTLAVIGLVGSVILLMMVNIPLEDNDQVSARWFDIAYYTIFTYSCLLGGLFITIILMLFNTIVSLIRHYHPESDAKLIYTSDGEEKEREEEKELQQEKDIRKKTKEKEGVAR